MGKIVVVRFFFLLGICLIIQSNRKLECNLIRVYTAISITMGESKFIHPSLDTMLLYLFSFIL